ncbi:hypothetical protein [Chryseobacterium daeguense]|uniref:hypothetical protein n=1 Tax=Chryseobacterium daeguense TaxID=412438 RepID=UPI0004293443|nr:hypothetical protein [Chryseobacterium daeguense]
MSQLGFTFYPKDWWTSDSFYTLNPFERYIYLELLFMMYDNSGYVLNDKIKVERRLSTTIREDVWVKITDLMVEEGGQLTLESVNKRIRKAIANRENGKKGGAPVGNQNAKNQEDGAEKQPKQPKKTTQNNPPYKEKEKEKIKRNEKETYRAFAHLSISFEEFEKLKSAGFSEDEIDSTLNDVENYKENKKYTSLYLTALKWLKKNREKNKDSSKPQLSMF